MLSYSPGGVSLAHISRAQLTSGDCTAVRGDLFTLGLLFLARSGRGGRGRRQKKKRGRRAKTKRFCDTIGRLCWVASCRVTAR